MNFLLKDGIIFTHNKKREILEADVLIEDGKIKGIGQYDRSEADVVLELNKKIVLPGFINTHFHLGETIYQNIVRAKSIEEYIQRTEEIWGKARNKKFILNATVDYSLLKLIRSGTSLFVASRNWMNVRRAKIRAFLGYPIMSSKKLRNYLKRFKNGFDDVFENFNSDKIKVGIWLHSLYFSNKEILKMVSEKFYEYKNIFLTVHINETEKERKIVKKNYGKYPIELLESYGLLSNRTLLVHCTYTTENEVQLIKKNHANVSLCPMENVLMGNKAPPIKKFLEEKVNISLASDGLVTGKTCNLLQIAKFSKNLWNFLSWQKLLDLITIDAARCIGIERDLGSLEKGKNADMVIFDNIPGFSKKSLAQKLILSSPYPSDLIVNGEFLMRDKKTFLDEKIIVSRFKKAREILCTRNI
jgi:5-methylthioadenosine/S-adenosylhomocysteine deaminase